jgi:GGDEF domain-containing protein
MEQTLESASRRAGRNNAAFALVQCAVEVPLDGSGRGNHTTGGEDPSEYETLLMTCVDRIRQRLRPSDTVARSGDSILVVAEDLGDEQDAAGVTYRVLSTVVEPVPTENGPVTVQMHAGTVVADGSTPLHKISPAAAGAARSVQSGGFELVDMRR